jgi:hypothetical protein
MATSARKPAAKPEVKSEEAELSSDIDVVVGVSRNADGSPKQTPGFVLLVPEDPTDEELAAAWNKDGEMPPKGQAIRFHPRAW